MLYYYISRHITLHATVTTHFLCTSQHIYDKGCACSILCMLQAEIDCIILYCIWSTFKRVHLRSLSMIYTVAVSLIYSPVPSTVGMKAGSSGVNLSMTVSSYSRVISSSVVNRQISVLFSKTMGCKFSKSKLPTRSEGVIHWTAY